MKGWRGLEAAADVLGTVPRRWSVPDVPRERAPWRTLTVALIDEGFDVVGRGLASLGPQEDDEPYFDTFDAGNDFADWDLFNARFSDRRILSGDAAREFLEARDQPSSLSGARAPVTWSGSMRAWLRWELGRLAQRIIWETPALHVDDPAGLREATLRNLDRVALLLHDHDQAACLAAMLNKVQLEISDLARRLWHHPNAGPKMKGALDELFSGNYAEILKSDPPTHHDDPPWILD